MFLITKDGLFLVMNKESRSGITFVGMLAILFIGLKLSNQIDWSWLWVLSPLWMPIAIVITVFMILAGINALYVLLKIK